MHSKIKVLVFPGEAENAFELYQALRYSTKFEVWGASSQAGYGNLIFPNYLDNLPKINDSDFLNVFNKFLLEKEITFIYPTHDDVALYLAEHSHVLEAKLIGSDARCADLCRAKKSLYNLLAQEPFCPKTFNSPEDVSQWPVFIKPNKGQGGIGGAKADDLTTLQDLWKITKDPVICEYLPGEEFTIDCFTDRHGELLFTGTRSRDIVKMGIAFVSRTICTDDETRYIAQTLNTILKPRGFWFFQTKRCRGGSLKLLEASCRAAGSMSVYRQLGVNLPLLAAYDAMDTDVKILKNNIPLTMRRRLHSSYIIDHDFEYVYVDYDDTIIINNRVNVQIMSFLYSCRNQGKRIFLLSRHNGDLLLDMQEFCIPLGLFEKIIHLKNSEKKSTFIEYKNSIFIDNLFTEREDVLQRTGIPVFDVDAVDGLL